MSETHSSILGTRVIRVEDPGFLTVGGNYIADLDLPGAAHVTYVRSTVAHARILSIDTEDARQAPGVVAVFTSADLGSLPPAAPPMPFMNPAMARPFLAGDRVRFVGEPVAVIVSDTRTQGADAAELILVGYEPLPAVIDFEHSATDPTLLFPDAGTNVVHEIPTAADPQLFDGCDVTVTARLENTRMAVAPIEPRACAAVWDGERLTQWACSQGAHNTRAGIAARLGLTNEQVRVIVPDVGGGFGGKQGTYPEEIMVGWLAINLDRPMGRVAHRAHGGLRARPRTGPVRNARRHPRRHVARLQAARGAGLRRLPVELRCIDAHDDAHHGIGLLPPPEDRVLVAIGSHEHHTGRRVPGCGSSRGRGGNRAHGRVVRHRGGRRRDRGATPQLHPSRAVPLRDAHRRELRRRCIPVGPRRRARCGGLHRTARRAGGASSTRRPRAHGHRHRDLRRDHEPHERGRVRGDRSACR